MQPGCQHSYFNASLIKSLQPTGASHAEQCTEHQERWQITKSTGHPFSKRSTLTSATSRLCWCLSACLNFMLVCSVREAMVPSFWHRNKYKVERHINLCKSPLVLVKSSCWPSPGHWRFCEQNFQNSLCSVHVQSSTFYLSIKPCKVHLLSMTQQTPLHYDFHYWK